MMDVQINGTPHQFHEDAIEVEALLERLDITQRKGVAVAVNDAVVPKSQWATHAVADGDRVEIIKATQGG